MDEPGPQISLDERITFAFPTPIARYLWPDSDALNAELRRFVLAAERGAAGTPKNVVGGWSSDKALLASTAEPVKALARRIHAMIAAMVRATTTSPREATVKYRLEAWANVLRREGYHNAHNHPNAMWSGVYYVALGPAEAERPLSGQLECLDPRAGAAAGTVPGSILTQRCRIAPAPGMMVVFPGFLVHMVHPYFGPGERISIAFNAYAPDLRYPAGEAAP